MYLYIGKQHGEIGLEDAGTLMDKYPKYAQRAIFSALSSEGFRLKKIISDTIRQGGPNGAWPKINPHTTVLSRGKLKNWRTTRKGVKKGEASRRYYDVRKRHYEIPTNRVPLIKLAGGTRYNLDRNMMVMGIGFLSGKSPGWAPTLAKKHAMGFSVPVTSRSRRWAFGLGFPLKKETTSLNIPPRPVVGPIFEKEKTQIIQNINRKVPEKIQEYISGKK